MPLPPADGSICVGLKMAPQRPFPCPQMALDMSRYLPKGRKGHRGRLAHKDRKEYQDRQDQPELPQVIVSLLALH